MIKRKPTFSQIYATLVVCTKPHSSGILDLFYRVSQKKHSYKIFCRCSHGMRAVEHAIIAMCRTLCPHSPAHKILGNHSCVFSNFSNFVSSHESSGAENFIGVLFLGHPVVHVTSTVILQKSEKKMVPPQDKNPSLKMINKGY